MTSSPWKPLSAPGTWPADRGWLMSQSCGRVTGFGGSACPISSKKGLVRRRTPQSLLNEVRCMRCLSVSVDGGVGEEAAAGAVDDGGAVDLERAGESDVGGG